MNTEEHGFEYIRVCMCVCAFFLRAHVCESQMFEDGQKKWIAVDTAVLENLYWLLRVHEQRQRTDGQQTSEERREKQPGLVKQFAISHAMLNGAGRAVRLNTTRSKIPRTIIFRGNTRYRFSPEYFHYLRCIEIKWNFSELDMCEGNHVPNEASSSWNQRLLPR